MTLIQMKIYFQENNKKKPLNNGNPRNRGEVCVENFPILLLRVQSLLELRTAGHTAKTDCIQLSRFYTSHLFEMPTICRIKSVLHAYQ